MPVNKKQPHCHSVAVLDLLGGICRRGLYFYSEKLNSLVGDGLCYPRGLASTAAQGAIPGETTVGIVKGGRPFGGWRKRLTANGAESHLRGSEAELFNQLASSLDSFALVLSH